MTGSGILDDGFHEASGIVHDLDDSIARLCGVFGYSLIWRGNAARATLDLMGIPPGMDAVEALVGDPAQQRGYVRLFAFPGHDTGVMRDGGQPWDHGGIFDINIRSLGPIEPLHQAMTRAGFACFAPITAWDFGALSVKEVVERDADGLAIAMMERIAPPLEGYEHVKGKASYVFNSTQVVPSFDAARAFFVDTLGWLPVQETRWKHEDGLNCMGLPLDTARERELRVGIYQSNGRNEGSVEILEYGGEGRDFSAAAPPDRGWAALRFPVADPAHFIATAAQGGCTILPCRTITMEPYGDMEAAVAITPWGARLEVYRPL